MRPDYRYANLHRVIDDAWDFVSGLGLHLNKDGLPRESVEHDEIQGGCPQCKLERSLRGLIPLDEELALRRERIRLGLVRGEP